jgi:hypothetical protein
MSTATDPPRDELRALRERAYGPSADIHDDPVALARLRELEAQAAAARGGGERPIPAVAEPDDGATADASARAATADQVATPSHPTMTDAAPAVIRNAPGTAGSDWAPAPLAPASADPEPAVTADGTAAPPDGPVYLPPDDAGAPAGEEQPRRWWWRRIPMLWAGAAAAAALLVGVGLTLAVQALDSGKVATLQVDEQAEFPEAFFGAAPAGALMFEDFHGLSVLSFRQSDSGGVQTCLYVLTAADGTGFGAASCGAGSFPATASLSVGSLSPRDLRAEFPPGTALQFVLDDSMVHVYARAPGIVEPTP